ncbi:hypothetical protein GC093_34835 [Paenibacillus sp. LMG 31456]|uniref:Uncharacterized protein n=1 Tax=Paenibacillus foliorum TaxID=2654974 RepID=A0A972GWV2_9BACL|nr:hypothetical protein [Paenibacillus foliorum]NOU98359.1 hypothetical protein [Paenibacillus foliorum]
MESSIEEILKNICRELILQLRGNNAGNGNALIDSNLISTLHTNLDYYKKSISNDDMVSKEIVSILIYTCSRFYVQSKHSKNSDEMLKEFDSLNGKLLRIFMTEDW